MTTNTVTATPIPEPAPPPFTDEDPFPDLELEAIAGWCEYLTKPWPDSPHEALRRTDNRMKARVCRLAVWKWEREHERRLLLELEVHELRKLLAWKAPDK